jgi:hypothetical protein
MSFFKIMELNFGKDTILVPFDIHRLKKHVYSNCVLSLFCFLTLIVSLSSCKTMAPTDDLRKNMPTQKTAYKANVDRNSLPLIPREYKHIIKNNTKGIYYGNPCALQVTRKMGFEYDVQVKWTQGSISEPSRNWKNLKVKLGLILRNSPFWKFRLKKKLRDCGLKTGDRVG